MLWGDRVFLNCGPGFADVSLGDEQEGRQGHVEDRDSRRQGRQQGRADWIGSWSTPVVVSIKGRDELIMTWPEEVRAYQPKTGEPLWWCRGLTKLVYTSPLVTPEVVVAMSGFGGSALGGRAGRQRRRDGETLRGAEKAQQRIGSGVMIGEHVYMVNEPGQMMCIEWKTGKVLWKERLSDKAVWGSLVHAGERLYVTNTDGETFVLAAKPKFEVLARNPLPKETTRRVDRRIGRRAIHPHVRASMVHRENEVTTRCTVRPHYPRKTIQ